MGDWHNESGKTYRCRSCGFEFTCCAECDALPVGPQFCSTDCTAKDESWQNLAGWLDEHQGSFIDWETGAFDAEFVAMSVFRLLALLPAKPCLTCGFDFAATGLDECTVCKGAKRVAGWRSE